MSSSKNYLHSQGFSLIELLVVISIIAILSGLTLVVVGSIRFQARNTVCASQLRQWGLSLNADAVDREGQLCNDQIQWGTGRNAHEFAVASYDRLIADFGMPTRIQGCPHTFTSMSIADYEAWSLSWRSIGFVLLGYAYWVQRSDLYQSFPPTNVACPTKLGDANPNNVPLMSDHICKQIGVDPLYNGHQLRDGAPRTSNQLFTDGHVSAVKNPSDIVWRYNGSWENWY